MVLALTAAVVGLVLGAALLLSARIRSRSRVQATEETDIRLPVGAEAAIWSILEAVPDPRNHLALTRDLTGEVRITGTPLDPAWHAAHPNEDPWTAIAERNAGDAHIPLSAA